jgi:hypothetical protein
MTATGISAEIPQRHSVRFVRIRAPRAHDFRRGRRPPARWIAKKTGATRCAPAAAGPYGGELLHERNDRRRTAAEGAWPYCWAS